MGRICVFYSGSTSFIALRDAFFVFAIIPYPNSSMAIDTSVGTSVGRGPVPSLSDYNLSICGNSVTFTASYVPAPLSSVSVWDSLPV